jgi:sulfate transport system ATP-binding protein
LYDRPANDFVMGFLGPVTRLGDQLVRPHDLEILTVPTLGAVQARVLRVRRIGVEVRAELAAGPSTPWVQLTHGQAEGLNLVEGADVWIRPAPQAATLAAQSA